MVVLRHASHTSMVCNKKTLFCCCAAGRVPVHPGCVLVVQASAMCAAMQRGVNGIQMCLCPSSILTAGEFTFLYILSEHDCCFTPTIL